MTQGKIAWLVPYPIPGSGGHRTIFAHIRYLVEQGHECHVYIGEDPRENMEISALREVVERCFGSCPASVHAGYQVGEHVDLAIATAWWTAEIVARNVDASHKLYFVQDFEPCFYPLGDEYIRAENSYRLGLPPLTIGRWMSHLLRERYGCDTVFFEFTADSSIYQPIEDMVVEPAVCFIYQPDKPRRCPETGRDALAIVKRQRPGVTIYTYGTSDEPGFHFDHTHLGLLTTDECNRLYNRCTVGLCLSSSNPSRIPFEMMAAGLPPVDFYGENTIYDLPDKAVLLAERNPSSLAGAMIRVLDNARLRVEMRAHGLAFMRQRPAGLEFEQCAARIEALLAGDALPGKDISPLYQAPPFCADYPVDRVPSPVQDESRAVPADPAARRRDLSFREWLACNRVARALKVMWKGYC